MKRNGSDTRHRFSDTTQFSLRKTLTLIVTRQGKWQHNTGYDNSSHSPSIPTRCISSDASPGGIPALVGNLQPAVNIVFTQAVPLHIYFELQFQIG